MSQVLRHRLKSVAVGKHIVKEILQRHLKSRMRFTNDILRGLIKHHPEAHRKKVEQVVAFQVVPDPRYKTPCLRIVRDDDSSDDISYLMCLKRLFGGTKVQVLASAKRNAASEALRNDAFPGTRRQFHKQHCEANGSLGVCSQCRKTEPLVVDHYPVAFSTILNEFLSPRNIAWQDVEAIQDDTGRFICRDRKFAGEWLTFHDSKASFRLLCRACNSRNGNYQ